MAAFQRTFLAVFCLSSMVGCEDLPFLKKIFPSKGNEHAVGTPSENSTNADTTGSKAISSPNGLLVVPRRPSISTQQVEGLKPRLEGSCDMLSSHSAISTVGSVQSVECHESKLSIVLHLPAGSDSFTVTVTSINSAGKSDSGAVPISRLPFVCPEGYVGVPGSTIKGLGNKAAAPGHEAAWLNVDKDFCVMKYPAKNNGSDVAMSIASGKPWSAIQRGVNESTPNSAFKACKDAGPGYRLISNTQWQTVARNAENVAANWSEGVVGKGSLSRGHSDNSAGTLASSSDNDPYFKTGNNDKQDVGKGWEQKRTLVLSNGEVVWDFGGNIWQWVSDDVASLGVEGTPAEEFQHFNSDTNATLKDSPTNKLLLGPSGSYEIQQNVGRMSGGTGGAIARGGYCTSEDISGLFTISLSPEHSDDSYFNGFRCVFVP